MKSFSYKGFFFFYVEHPILGTHYEATLCYYYFNHDAFAYPKTKKAAIKWADQNQHLVKYQTEDDFFNEPKRAEFMNRITKTL